MKRMSEYKYHYGLKMRIYPNDKQKEMIRVNSDVTRFVYNEMVAINKEIGRFGKRKIAIDFIDKRIAELREQTKVAPLRNRFPWLRNPKIDSFAISNARQNYQKAWHQFRLIRHSGVPNFHKKSYRESYQTNATYQKGKVPSIWNGSARFLDSQHIIIPRLRKVRFSVSKKMIAKIFSMQSARIGTVTVSKNETNDYYVSLQLAADEPFAKKLVKTNSQIGIDLNIENFYADSNGNIIDNPKYYRKSKKRLAHAQRVLGKRAARAKREKRPLKTAKNYQKQRLKVARIAKSIMNRRRNFLHNQSMALIKNHDLVVAEELRSRNLLKNHALAMSIQDNGWRTFLNMLTYKAEIYGKTFITVNPRNTTQTCHSCGNVLTGKDKLTLQDREWTCPYCGVHHIRDINAAKNILAKGKEKLATK